MIKSNKLNWLYNKLEKKVKHWKINWLCAIKICIKTVLFSFEPIRWKNQFFGKW
jgi:hypothetical protein